MSSSAGAEPVLRLNGEKVHEDLRKDALISGNWLVGALTVAPRSDLAPRLMGYVPGGSEWGGQTLCARATDQSGRYSALFEYDIPQGWSGGLVEFDYQTDFSEFLGAVDETNSGVALHRGDCRTVTDTFLPVHWNTQELPTKDQNNRVELVLNINAGRSDSVVATATSTAGDADIACLPTQTPGVGFNYQCRALVPGDRAGVLSVEISRLRYGRASRALSADFHVYPAPKP